MLYVKNPGVPLLFRMNVLSYYFGFQRRCYLLDAQRQTVAFNANNDRFFYNRGVVIQPAEWMLQLLQLKFQRKRLGELPFGSRYLFMYFDQYELSERSSSSDNNLEHDVFR